MTRYDNNFWREFLTIFSLPTKNPIEKYREFSPEKRKKRKKSRAKNLATRRLKKHIFKTHFENAFSQMPKFSQKKNWYLLRRLVMSVSLLLDVNCPTHKNRELAGHPQKNFYILTSRARVGAAITDSSLLMSRTVQQQPSVYLSSLVLFASQHQRPRTYAHASGSHHRLPCFANW